MRVDDATIVKLAVERILVRCARIICDLYSSETSGAVVVDVEVRGLVEAVKYRSNCGRRKVVVNVGIATTSAR